MNDSNEDKKPLEVVFAPGCFDNFDGTQEELDGLMAEIMSMAASGEIEANSRPIDLDNLSEEEEEMLEFLHDMDQPDSTRNLQ